MTPDFGGVQLLCRWEKVGHLREEGAGAQGPGHGDESVPGLTKDPAPLKSDTETLVLPSCPDAARVGSRRVDVPSPQPAMPSLPLRSPFRKPLPWLFWLALLWPLAQAVATSHSYSHVLAGSAEHPQDSQAPHASSCDLCLTAAALAAGALVDGRVALPITLVAAAPPSAWPASVWRAATERPYQSRAPPLAPA